jgi:hypothetical protein
MKREHTTFAMRDREASSVGSSPKVAAERQVSSGTRASSRHTDECRASTTLRSADDDDDLKRRLSTRYGSKDGCPTGTLDARRGMLWIG